MKNLVCCVFAICWILFCSGSLFASDHRATDCTDDAVQAMMTEATESGAVVTIPPCTGGDSGHWNQQVSWTAPANAILRCGGSTSVRGGGDVTIIYDDFASTDALLSITINSSGTFRMYGCTFKGGDVSDISNTKYNGMLSFTSAALNENLRIDHVTIDKTTYSPSNNGLSIRTYCASGVIDNVILKAASGGVAYGVAAWGCGFGDAEWAADTGLGTGEFLFLENSKFDGGIANDIWAGGRMVLRYNEMVEGASFQTHPTVDFRMRGGRAWEVYGNTFTHSDVAFDGLFVSAGTGVAWGNTFTSGTYANLFTLHSFRRSNLDYNETMTPYGWGYCGPDYQTGTVDTSGTTVTWVSGTQFNTSWPANTMFTYLDTTTDCGGHGCSHSFRISSVGSTTSLTLASSAGTNTGVTYRVGSNFDQNSGTLYGKRCMDQPGNGKGDLLSGDFSSVINSTNGSADYTSANAWPRQALEPVYEWNNTWACGGCGGSRISIPRSAEESPVLASDSEYYVSASGIQTTSSSPFNGTTGTGWGTISNRPTTCTTGVGYFATNEGGNWNTANSTANDGKMYICTSTNTWTARLGGDPTSNGIPYTYPHPLRHEVISPTCDSADVLASADLLSAGDTLTIMTGTCHWDSVVALDSLPERVTIQGYGNHETIIVDDHAMDNALLLLAGSGAGTATQPAMRLTNIRFEGGDAGGAYKNWGLVQFNSSSYDYTFRFDNLEFEMGSYININGGQQAANVITLFGCLHGVVDSNLFNANGGARVAGNCYGDQGDTEWSQNTEFGDGGKWVVAEDNTQNPLSQYTGFNDCYQAARWVVRFNILNGSAVQTHPTGGSGRSRGCRGSEAYMNTFNGNSHGTQFNAFFLSSGPSLFFGNTFTDSGDYSNIITLHSMRRNNGTYGQVSAPTKWGFCGKDFWAGTVDTSGTTVTKVSGTHDWITGSGQNTSTIDADALVVIDGVTYTVASLIDATTLTLTSSAGIQTGKSFYVLTNFDENPTTDSGYHCMDQPGLGKSDLLTGDFGTGVGRTKNTARGDADYTSPNAYPRNAIEGFYYFNNTVVCLCDGSEFSIYEGDSFVQNTDYFRGTASFNGTTSCATAPICGVGSGSRASRPSSTTNGLAWWATNAGGDWNTKAPNSSANDGCLDKVVSGAWVDCWYTPLTYPHPLRDGGFSAPSTPPESGTFDYIGTFTVQSAQMPASQADFSFLIYWTDDALKQVGGGGHVQNANGYDIRPYSDSGLTTALSYQLIRYDGSAGTIHMRIKNTGGVGSSIYMGVGSADFTMDGSSSSAWDGNTKGFYHFGDGSSLSLEDKGPINNVLTNNGTSTAVAGKVDGAVTFNGSSQYLNTTTGYLPTDGTHYTVGCWAYPASTSAGAHNIFTLGSNTGYSIQLRRDGSDWNLYQNDGMGNNINATQASGVTANTWKHVAGVWDGSNIVLYVNGSQAQSTATSLRASNGTIQSWGFELPDMLQYWDGRLDECRIDNTERSANWLASVYNNENNQSAFWGTVTFSPNGGLSSTAAGVLHRRRN